MSRSVYSSFPSFSLKGPLVAFCTPAAAFISHQGQGKLAERGRKNNHQYTESYFWCASRREETIVLPPIFPSSPLFFPRHGRWGFFSPTKALLLLCNNLPRLLRHSPPSSQFHPVVRLRIEAAAASRLTADKQTDCPSKCRCPSYPPARLPRQRARSSASRCRSRLQTRARARPKQACVLLA
jgi:hypothetical protein